MIKKIALATYSGRPELTESDAELVAPLAKLGFEAVGAPWDDSSIKWSQFDAVVIRSTWNYHHYPNQFREWIQLLSDSKVKLLNSADVLLWNMDKIYLKNVSEQGVSVVPTYWADRHSDVNLEDLMSKRSWNQVIVKPRIGASADFVLVVIIDEAAQMQSQFQQLLSEHHLMVQPLVEEIRQGEWSIMFVHDEYCHASLKTPKDVFVQAEHGGTWKIEEPQNHLIESALKTLKAAQQLTGEVSFLYSRVDCVEVDGSFMLMELELIEPELFLKAAPQSAERLAAELAKAI